MRISLVRVYMYVYLYTRTYSYTQRNILPLITCTYIIKKQQTSHSCHNSDLRPCSLHYLLAFARLVDVHMYTWPFVYMFTSTNLQLPTSTVTHMLFGHMTTSS